mmetsp:Transcript_5231/g.12423  ORF Transcript_5231/g.12423 Transcript_5231/m.12423 type:complete len:551 (-) Transcript_5231:74-1726(-)
MITDHDRELIESAAVYNAKAGVLGSRLRAFSEEASDSDEDQPYSRGGQPPEAVRKFLTDLQNSVLFGNVQAVLRLYENHPKLTDRYFKSTSGPGQRWPDVTVVGEILTEKVAMLLYRDLYYRHVFDKCQTSVKFEDRKESWDNYCGVFDYVMEQIENPGSFRFHLPALWIWDIMDEFIYQFSSYRLHVGNLMSGSKQTTNRELEIKSVKDNPDIFATHIVLRYLHRMIRVSRIHDYLKLVRDGSDPDTLPEDPSADHYDALTSETARYFGYFAIMQLMRVHTMLGDYWLALKTVEVLETRSPKALFYKVLGCHISLFYQTGFSYMMMRRYQDAIRAFSSLLQYRNTTRSFGQHGTAQFSEKKQEQIAYLLHLCTKLCPTPVDDSLQALVREKPPPEDSEVAFTVSAPKFFNPAAPDFEISDIDSRRSEPANRQKNLFRRELQEQSLLPQLRSYLRLYTAIPLKKLASFQEVDERTLQEMLMCGKHKTWQMERGSEPSPLSGAFKSCGDVEFQIENDVVHVTTQRQSGRKYAETFLRNIQKLEALLVRLQN